VPIPAEQGTRMMASMTGAHWLSLHTTNPGPVGGDELVGNGYRRQKADMEAFAAGAVRNTGVVVFPMLPASSVTHVGVWDAEDDGRLLWVAQLAEPKSFAQNQTFFFEAEAVEFGLTVMGG